MEIFHTVWLEFQICSTAEAKQIRHTVQFGLLKAGQCLLGKSHSEILPGLQHTFRVSPNTKVGDNHATCKRMSKTSSLILYRFWLLCLLPSILQIHFKIEPWKLSAKEKKAWKLFGPSSHYSLGKTSWIMTRQDNEISSRGRNGPWLCYSGRNNGEKSNDCRKGCHHQERSLQ